MPVTIKSVQMKYKDQYDNYVGVDAVSDFTTEQKLEAINTAGTTQTGAVNSAGETQLAAVNGAGSTQITNINNRATEIENSWPSDYSDLTDDVEDLKSALTETITITSKNLFNPTYLAGVDGWTNSDGDYYGPLNNVGSTYGSGYPLGTFEENTRYTISFKHKCDNDQSVISIQFYYTDGTHGGKAANASADWASFSTTSVKNKTVSYVVITYGAKGSAVWHLKEIQFELGTEATEYQPYGSIDAIRFKTSAIPDDSIEKTQLAFDIDEMLDEKISEPETAGTLGQVLTCDGEGGAGWGNIVIPETIPYGKYNINTDACEVGALAWATGAESASTTKIRSGFIPVTAGEYYEVYSNNDNPADVQYIFEYNASKGFIQFITMSGSMYCASENTAYIRTLTAQAGDTYPLPDVTKFVIEVDKWYRKNAFKESKLGDVPHDYFSVSERQRDVFPHVCASCRYGVHSSGTKNAFKQFSILMTADPHGCASAMLAAVEYMNKTDCIDCGIALGDIKSGNIDSDASFYTYVNSQAAKPFFTVIGNHDTGEGTSVTTAGSSTQIFEKFIEPNLSAIGIVDLDTPYYAKTFAEYGIVLIVLDSYDLPDTLSDSTHYLVQRNKYNCWSQDQIDWFIETLSNVPADYHVIIALHDSLMPAEKISGAWTQPDPEVTTGGASPIYSGDLIPDIVNAWVNGTTHTYTYAPISAFPTLPSIEVDADFTERGSGDFVAYITGHRHCDIHAKSTTYADQNIIALVTTANDNYQGYRNDIPRVRGTKTDEAFTVMGVDTGKRMVKLVRVGSAITTNMVDRTMYSFNY